MRRKESATRSGGSNLLLMVVALAAIFMSVGCATQVGPRYVDQITSSKKSVKLLYHQQVGAETKRGLIECERNKDGSLQNCQNVNIHFKE